MKISERVKGWFYPGGNAPAPEPEPRPGRVEQRADGGAGVNHQLVPAGTTVSQILDAVRGTGADWLLDGYGFGLGLGYSRDAVVQYSALNRVVTLIAGVLADLMTRGGLQIRANGARVDDARSRQVLRLLSETPDDNETPAYTFIEDLASDYLLDGNALITPMRGSGGTPEMLTRWSGWESSLVPVTGPRVYRLRPVGRLARAGTVEYAAARDVAHIRWPMLTRYGRGTEGFAVAPVRAMRPALEIGLLSDRYVRDWFAEGARSKLAVSYSDDPGELSDEDRQELAAYVYEAVRKRLPLVLFGGKVDSVNDVPQDSAAQDLRDFQIAETARYYGLPPTLVGVNVSQWGSGIAELSRLAWRYGLKQHFGRMVAPLENTLLRTGERLVPDTTELLRGDMDSVAKLVQVLSGNGNTKPLATQEEMRHVAGLARDPDGDYPEPMQRPGMSAPQSRNGRLAGV